MLSASQLVIVAYVTDGAIVCRDCGEKAGLPTKDALIEYSAQEYASEENRGLYCDDCGEEIIPMGPQYHVDERYESGNGHVRYYPRWDFDTEEEAQEKMDELKEDSPEEFAAGKWVLGVYGE